MVIGGTRFVGLRLVKILAEYGHDITLLNRGKTQVDLPSGVKRLYADRRNPTEISQVLKSQDFEMVCDMTGRAPVLYMPRVSNSQ
jgi:nucleoside-diphosphate-sugar epimerase